ncbi:hypothetical protein ES703_36979 [subsurface metagenome]
MTDSSSHEVKIARDATITFSGHFVGNALRYLFNLLLARVLGVELVCTYSISNSVVQVFTGIGRLGLDLSQVVVQTDNGTEYVSNSPYLSKKSAFEKVID